MQVRAYWGPSSSVKQNDELSVGQGQCAISCKLNPMVRAEVQGIYSDVYVNECTSDTDTIVTLFYVNVLYSLLLFVPAVQCNLTCGDSCEQK